MQAGRDFSKEIYTKSSENHHKSCRTGGNMKNLRRKFTAFGLVAVLTVASVLPVYAGNMSSFPMQSQSDYTTRYARGIQVMMLYYNTTTRAYIQQAGGADGVYGSGTANAVTSFQTARGIGADGICGPTTWSHMRSTLRYTGRSSDGYNLYKGYYNSTNHMRQYNVTNGSWYCNASGWKYVG